MRRVSSYEVLAMRCLTLDCEGSYPPRDWMSVFDRSRDLTGPRPYSSRNPLKNGIFIDLNIIIRISCFLQLGVFGAFWYIFHA